MRISRTENRGDKCGFPAPGIFGFRCGLPEQVSESALGGIDDVFIVAGAGLALHRFGLLEGFGLLPPVAALLGSVESPRLCR
jgi:hypothetical protein